ncbi:uncharacterized protein LOC104667997 [Rhinopithecus roxellana]|uniref:uncharacterized protein LOC104667997 n=1 Tax=Rhinopithecus roxellana TaxID=61622 RepID=UPI00053306B7|nr:uncharacterized protein LOC104667997 [Rhinopithecus roxellana]XP_017710435.1 PREDICTED: translation initiation factor IF-2-like [Rhinopithecus bieti]
MPDSAGSRGPGLAEGPPAGGGAAARAGGPPSPALAGAQPQGHVDCLWRKPALGEGKAGSVLPLQGEPPLRAGGDGGLGLPSRLLSERGGGGGGRPLARERRRPGCVR